MKLIVCFVVLVYILYEVQCEKDEKSKHNIVKKLLTKHLHHHKHHHHHHHHKHHHHHHKRHHHHKHHKSHHHTSFHDKMVQELKQERANPTNTSAEKATKRQSLPQLLVSLGQGFMQLGSNLAVNPGNATKPMVRAQTPTAGPTTPAMGPSRVVITQAPTMAVTTSAMVDAPETVGVESSETASVTPWPIKSPYTMAPSSHAATKAEKDVADDGADDIAGAQQKPHRIVITPTPQTHKVSSMREEDQEDGPAPSPTVPGIQKPTQPVATPWPTKIQRHFKKPAKPAVERMPKVVSPVKEDMPNSEGPDNMKTEAKLQAAESKKHKYVDTEELAVPNPSMELSENQVVGFVPNTATETASPYQIDKVDQVEAPVQHFGVQLPDSTNTEPVQHFGVQLPDSPKNTEPVYQKEEQVNAADDSGPLRSNSTVESAGNEDTPVVEYVHQDIPKGINVKKYPVKDEGDSPLNEDIDGKSKQKSIDEVVTIDKPRTKMLKVYPDDSTGAGEKDQTARKEDRDDTDQTESVYGGRLRNKGDDSTTTGDVPASEVIPTAVFSPNPESDSTQPQLGNQDDTTRHMPLELSQESPANDVPNTASQIAPNNATVIEQDSFSSNQIAGNPIDGTNDVDSSPQESTEGVPDYVGDSTPPEPISSDGVSVPEPDATSPLADSTTPAEDAHISMDVGSQIASVDMQNATEYSSSDPAQEDQDQPGETDPSLIIDSKSS